MSKRDAVVEVLLSPLEINDKHILTRSTFSPPQHLKVLPDTKLLLIASYANNNYNQKREANVAARLCVYVNGQYIDVPQTLNILELALLTHQKNVVQLYFYFYEANNTPQVPKYDSPYRAQSTPSSAINSPAKNYSPSKSMPVYRAPLSPPFASIVHTGLSMFSSPFSLPSSNDSRRASPTSDPGGKSETINLRKELEALIRK